ncbi:hypothetical protein Ddc_08477 [Ditylenchus destructor]|nr:hypothetical protein Ddc_08477 [Ditylenchus destructor]
MKASMTAVLLVVAILAVMFFSETTAQWGYGGWGMRRRMMYGMYPGMGYGGYGMNYGGMGYGMPYGMYGMYGKK